MYFYFILLLDAYDIEYRESVSKASSCQLLSRYFVSHSDHSASSRMKSNTPFLSSGDKKRFPSVKHQEVMSTRSFPKDLSGLMSLNVLYFDMI